MFKLATNVVATAVLLLYVDSVSFLAREAKNGGLASGAHDGLQSQAILHSGAAIVLLLGAVVLSVYKPRGLTRHGRRMRAEQIARGLP